MVRRSLRSTVLASLVLAGCAVATPSRAPSAVGVPSGPHLPRCSDVQEIGVPPEALRLKPVYVGNEQPIEEIRSWAQGKPAFEDLWIDRDHNGWVVLAFSADAPSRQRELEAAFPDVGVAAVGVPWTMTELERIQSEVSRDLMPEPVSVSGISVMQGVVTVGIGLLTPERIAIIEERFAGKPVCIEGVDPADAPAPGPQQPSGDGWRLLADEQAGQAYRTGIAFDDASLERLWADAGVAAPIPEVDWEHEVVIWFGAVYGSSCPDLRLDDVVVTSGLVHAEIVLVGAPMACTADANPRAYVVALQRSRLPAPRFAIQLSAADPPGGVPEERTVVDADLRAPGSVAAPEQIHGDPNLPPPSWVEPGGTIETGFETPFLMTAHCGVEWLGPLNGITWRTTVPDGITDFVPQEWEPVVTMNGSILLTLVMTEGPDPTVTATTNGFSLIYRPTAESAPECD